MNGAEVLRIVDAIHRDKSIDSQIVFEGIEQAILSAARKHFGDEQELVVDIDRDTGEPSLKCDGELLDPEILGDLLGRVSAQTAKQVMIQKIREAERDALYDEFSELRTQIVTGTVSRIEHGAAIVNLSKCDGFLPRSEQIPGEMHRVGERVRAIVMDVRKSGSRVKIILSRTHAEFVRRLFEIEIPEVADNIIEVRSLAREAGYRSKVAVSCFDSKIDCVGACVGVRGSRIKSIVDELGGERIDIVRWNDSLQVLVPNGLQPAEVEDVILCPMLGKVIVLVRDEQLSLAIGKKGQNVRLASKLVGWDINVMTQERLDEQLNDSIEAFSAVPGVDEELAENLVSQGFFTFDDLSVIEPDQLAELSGKSAEECDVVIEYADEQSLLIEEQEKIAVAEARKARRQAELDAASGNTIPTTDSASTEEVATEEVATEEVATEEVAAEDDSSADESGGDEDAVVAESSDESLAEDASENADAAQDVSSDGDEDAEPQAVVEVAAESADTEADTQPAAATDVAAEETSDESPKESD